jgi:acetyl-CoA synthetase
MLRGDTSYESEVKEFRWNIPEKYNIGVAVCNKWAALDPEQLALIHEHGNGHITRVSFGELRRRSNQTANCLRKRGVTQGSRVFRSALRIVWRGSVGVPPAR